MGGDPANPRAIPITQRKGVKPGDLAVSQGWPAEMVINLKAAQALGLGASTVSHHLSRLAKAGLVSARADGHYYIYSLQTDVLQAMAQRLLSTEELPRLSDDANLDAYDRKVIADYTRPDGSLITIPAQ